MLPPLRRPFAYLCTACYTYLRRQQGFGPTTPTTVENVIKNGADDEYVILRGRFTSHIKSDKYEFQDEAGGVITAELDHDRNWSMVHRGKLMEIRAKVDRDWNMLSEQNTPYIQPSSC